MQQQEEALLFAYRKLDTERRLIILDYVTACAIDALAAVESSPPGSQSPSEPD